MPTPVKPWRVIVKGLVIFCVINLAFIYLYPWLSNNQIYNRIVPGRLRFPWGQPDLEQTVHSLSLYDNMDAMFASHIISANDKPTDEFRVIFLGDSSIWGDGIPVSGTLPEQINMFHLQNCRGQRIVAYNLALPSLYVMKDFLILNEAMKYQPDLIVWGVTLQSLVNSDQNASLFLPSQSDEALYLINHYHLNISTSALRPKTIWDRTLFANRANIKRLITLEEDALPWVATGIDDDVTANLQIQIGNDINPKNIYMLHGSTIASDNLMLDVISSADVMAHHVPILILNEPIFIASGKNSQQYYNSYDSRLLYDQYRNIISNWAYSHHQPYMDIWDSVPSSEFTNTPFHLSINGEKQLASLISPSLLGLSCSQ